MIDVPTPAERESAIQFLIEAIPQETLANVRMLMQNRQTPWHLASHYNLGLWVRNSLRGAGFKWIDAYMDDHWHELVEEAARTGDRVGEYPPVMSRAVSVVDRVDDELLHCA